MSLKNLQESHKDADEECIISNEDLLYVKAKYQDVYLRSCAHVSKTHEKLQKEMLRQHHANKFPAPDILAYAPNIFVSLLPSKIFPKLPRNVVLINDKSDPPPAPAFGPIKDPSSTSTSASAPNKVLVPVIKAPDSASVHDVNMKSYSAACNPQLP